MLVSTALLALQCCRSQSLSVLGVSCSPCALVRCAARGFYAGVNCASRVAVLPCAVAVYPRRLCCSPSPCALARCAARLLCWFQLRFSYASRVAVLPCVRPLSTIGVCCSPSPCALARCAARLLCWLQLRFSRCSAAVCSCCLPSRRQLFSVAVCSRSMRCQLLCWLQLRFSRCSAAVHVQLLSILGVGCSPSPCALARCAARLLCWF